jgi:protease-4
MGRSIQVVCRLLIPLVCVGLVLSARPNRLSAADIASKDGKKEKSTAKLAVLDLDSSFPEGPEQDGLFGEVSVGLNKIIERLDQAKNDAKINAVLLRIRDPQIGRGKLDEFRAAIARVRKAGKKVYADVRSADSKPYLIASACDEIIMPESGTLAVTGVRAELTFFKDLLDKLGVKAEMMQIGAYKGAAEPLTRSGMSPEFRKQFESVIDDYYNQMIATIAHDRKLDSGKVKDVIDEGLFTATAAKEAGLVDRVAYIDEFRKDLGEKMKVEEVTLVEDYGKKQIDADFSGFGGMMKFMQMLMGGENQEKGGKNKKIAVVYAVGVITEGESGGGLFSEATLGGDTLAKAIRDADANPKVVAIVLRIDSPGGSALASDLVWREVVRAKKPIVASMGDVAASGGYYIAMGAKKIIAEPGTLTGSIGVVGGKVALKGLFEKVGIKTESISRGKLSGWESVDEPFTPAEREAWMKSMKDIYRQFTTKAAEGRKIELKHLQDDLAGGRVYTGKMAVDNKLVDRLGTLDDAVAEAKSLAGLKADEPIDRLDLPKPKTLFEMLFGNSATEAKLPIPKEIAEQFARAATMRRLLSHPAVLVMPFEIQIK